MGIMPDSWIRKMAVSNKMIDPFVDKLEKKNVLSYGLSSYGYDARVSRSFKIFTNVNSATVDPKKFSESSFVDRDVDQCIIPPNSFALARTVEYFRIPKETLVVCVGKSTYARCGIIVNVTPLSQNGKDMLPWSFQILLLFQLRFMLTKELLSFFF